MKLTTKMMAIGAVAVLAVAGVALAMMGSGTVSASSDGAPIVTMSGQADGASDSALSLQVTTRVDGRQVPLAGAEVCVCNVSIVREQDRTTYRIVNMTSGQTDANGTYAFGAPQGHYFAYAYNNGQRGLCQGNLTDDDFGKVKAHQWGWGAMNGEIYQCMNQAQGRINSSDSLMAQSGNGDMVQDRDQDRLRDGSCDGVPQTLRSIDHQRC